MGTLAFDPEELAALATALCTAADQLGALHCGDVAAQPALAAAAAARTSFEQWAGQALQIAGCGALSEYQPIAIDIDDVFLALDYVLANGYGWRTTDDQTGYEWTIPPVMQASALGYVLSHGEPPLASSSEELRLLAELQAALADPAALAALRANLTVEGIAALTQRLAEHRADLVVQAGGPPNLALGCDPELAQRIDMTDQIAAALATVLVDPAKPLDEARAALDTMRPFAAALLISQLDAPDDVVVTLAEDAMRRYYERRNEPHGWPAPWELPDAWSLGIGDLLFPRIADCAPQAANRFVLTLGSMSQELLTATVHDAGRTAALVVKATDPITIGERAAGGVIVPLLEHLQHPPPYPDVPSSVFNMGNAITGMRPFLGAVIAPWMLQFTEDEDAFGLNNERRDEALRFVLDDDQAFADVVEMAHRWGESLPLSDPATDKDALQDNLDRIGWAVGQLTGLLEERFEDDARRRQATWDFVVSLLPRALARGVSFAGVTGAPAKVIVRVGSAGISEAAEYVQEHELFGSLAPLSEVLHDMALQSDQAMAAGSYLSMVAMRALLVERGELPDDTPDVPAPWDGAACPSGDYFRDSKRWIRRNIPVDQQDTMTVAARTFVAPGSASLACQRLENG